MNHQKKTYRIIIVLFLLALNCSCQNTNDKNQGIYIFPDSLYAFFPKYNNEAMNLKFLFLATNRATETNLPYSAEEFSTSVLLKAYKYDKKQAQIDSLMNSWKKRALCSVSAGSIDYFVIGSERDLFIQYDTTTLANKFKEYQNKNIVINFRDLLRGEPAFYDSTTISGLPRDFRILTLFSGNKYLLADKYKYDWNMLPSKIKHGYRSGVAFKESEQYLIYWVVAW
jgi:hypothetical protein